jgi:hypothetical protein
MTITFSKISETFSDFLKNPSKEFNYGDELHRLIYLSIKTNKTLWDLEDSARLSELGDKHVAEAKKSIDKINQSRNNLIREIDMVLYKDLGVISSSPDKFYSESPGMIIDRLSIIFIKLSIVQKLVLLMKEDDLRSEYADKEKVLADQIRGIGQFLDMYMEKLVNGDVFFEIQQPVKIYNDVRVREYIKSLNSQMN